jgi:hypothetical protein
MRVDFLDALRHFVEPARRVAEQKRFELFEIRVAGVG